MSRSCKERSDYHEQIIANLPNAVALERYHNTLLKLPEQASAVPGTKDHYLVQLKRFIKDDFRLGDRADYRHNIAVLPNNNLPYQLINTQPQNSLLTDIEPLRTKCGIGLQAPRQRDGMIVSAYDETYVRDREQHVNDNYRARQYGTCDGDEQNHSSCYPQPGAEMLFYGWLGQRVADHDQYPHHVRKLKIVFYCDDDTIEVIEPFAEDGGRRQQVFFSRQLMPKAETPGYYYELKDFLLGVWHTYYGHQIQICDASDSTKQALLALGYRIGDPVAVPNDKFTAQREAIKFAKSHQTYHVPTHKEFDKRWRSETLSGVVLRFFAILDERHMPYGLIRKVELQFFVEDGTVQIVEPMVQNDGRNPQTSRIIKRTQVPRSGLSVPAEIPQYNISKMISELPLITEDDFRVGQKVKLFSRVYFIYDADDFTRRYYNEKNNGQQAQPASIDWEEAMFPNRKLRRAQAQNEINAYKKRQYIEEVNSPGGGILPLLEESVSYMADKQRRIAHATKQLNYGDTTLTFSARMLNNNTDAAAQTPVGDGSHDYMIPLASPNQPCSTLGSASRKFVISIGVSTDLITVFELRRQNSGFKGGTMFGPHKVPKFPAELCLQTQRRAVEQAWRASPVYLSLDDFYVGNVIDVHGYNFELLVCDDKTAEFCAQCSPAIWSPAKVEAMRASATAAKQHPFKYENGFFDHYVGSRKGEFVRCEGDLDYLTDRVVLDLREKTLQRRINIWRAFLLYDNERRAYLDASALQRALKYMNLPSDDDIVQEIMKRAALTYRAEGAEAARDEWRRDKNNCVNEYSVDNDGIKTLKELEKYEATTHACSSPPDKIKFEEFNALIENSTGYTWRKVMYKHPCISGPTGPREGYLYNTDLPYIHYEPDRNEAGSPVRYKYENIPGGIF